MNKKEYLNIIEEIKNTDSISRRHELNSLLGKRLKLIIDYLMSQEYCSQVADWRIEEGPAYYKDSVYILIEYHIPRYSREDIDIDIDLNDFLDDNYINRLKEEQRIKQVTSFNYHI